MFFIGFRDERVHSLIFLVVVAAAAPAKRAEDDPSRLTARAATGIPKRYPPARPPAYARKTCYIAPCPSRRPPRPVPRSPPHHRADDRRPKGKEVLPAARPSAVLCDYTGCRPIEQTSMERDRRAEFCQRRCSVEDLFSKRSANAAAFTPSPTTVRDVGASARNAIFEDSVAFVVDDDDEMSPYLGEKGVEDRNNLSIHTERVFKPLAREKKSSHCKINRYLFNVYPGGGGSWEYAKRVREKQKKAIGSFGFVPAFYVLQAPALFQTKT